MKKNLKYTEWNKLADEHSSAVENLLGEWDKNRKKEIKNPVIDFLFRYFSFPYNRLKSWTPGLDFALEGPMNGKLSKHRFLTSGKVLKLNDKLLPRKRVKALKWTISLLEKTMENQALFNCYGLHEWAMLYKSDGRRHEYTKLRVSSSEICRVVEEKELNCTHYDAIRFYTQKALPMNKFQPTRESQENYEQSACLHANMDLYKWAYKMYPFIGSELLLKCLKLALDCRTVDMKASPYDLRDLGYEPIKIETNEGKENYVREQFRLKKAAEPLRKRLLSEYEKILQRINCESF